MIKFASYRFQGIAGRSNIERPTSNEKGEVPYFNNWSAKWLPALAFGSSSTIFTILTEYSNSLSSMSLVSFFTFSHSKFDVGRSMFDVHFFQKNLPQSPGQKK
jgi:hypothetical protein